MTWVLGDGDTGGGMHGYVNGCEGSEMGWVGEMEVTKNGFQIGCKGKINHDG